MFALTSGFHLFRSHFQSCRSQSSKAVTFLTAPSIVSLTSVTRCDSDGHVELLISTCSVES